MEKTELRGRILDAAALLFNEKGVKFTMDDIARSLAISKKTIYTVFPGKYELMIETLDRYFDMAHESQTQVLEDTALDPVEKLRRILSLVPAQYENVDLRHVYVLRDKYPAVYRYWRKRREAYWNVTEGLLRDAMEKGLVRKVSIPVFKVLYQSAIEHFFEKDILIRHDISYKDALAEVAGIVTDGIRIY